MIFWRLVKWMLKVGVAGLILAAIGFVGYALFGFLFMAVCAIL